MATLKKFFSLSFKYSSSVGDLIIGILVYILFGIVAGAVITLSTFLTAWIPLVGGILAWALGVIGSLIGVYTLAGIIIMLLVFFKVLKD